jgi:hypothetical protein
VRAQSTRAHRPQHPAPATIVRPRRLQVTSKSRAALLGAVLCLGRFASAATEPGALHQYTPSPTVVALRPALRPPGTRPILAQRGAGKGPRQGPRRGLARDGTETGGETERTEAMSASDYAQLFGTTTGQDVVAPTLQLTEHAQGYDALFGRSVSVPLTEGSAVASKVCVYVCACVCVCIYYAYVCMYVYIYYYIYIL